MLIVEIPYRFPCFPACGRTSVNSGGDLVIPTAKITAHLCRAREEAGKKIGIDLFVMAGLDPAIQRTIEFADFFSG
jgi:hypothetical protein